MLIKLENVEKHYNQFHLNCSLEIKEGFVTGIIGQNGSGKSTTFKTILNLVHTDGGNVEVFGKHPNVLTVKEKEEIGVVLADAGFSEYLTAVDVAAILDKMYEKFKKEEFFVQCEEFQIPINKKMKDFSTGMKAKLKLLVAISHHPKLLILDEPTAGLDVVAREKILDVLRDFMEEPGHAILISSHISSDLEGLCDDIYMIDEGKIILHEETDVLLDRYGVLKLTEEQYGEIDKSYILNTKKEAFGYRCLTKEKQFYVENYPQMIIEKSTIDEMISIMIGGAKK